MSTSPNRQEMELIAAAAGAERSNRPRWLIVLAAVLFAIALIYLMTSMGALAQARGGLSKAEEQLATVQDRVEKYRAEATAVAERAVPEDNATAPKMEQLASLVGLDVQVTDDLDNYNDRGVRRRTLRASLTNADPGLFLSWIHTVVQSDDLRGIQIRTLNMRPQVPRPGEPVGWNVDITFDRLERRA